MPFAIVLYFDPSFTEQIKKIRSAWAAIGIKVDKNSAPHLTLAICDEIDTEQVKSKLHKLASITKECELNFLSLGIFSFPKPVIFISPKIEPNLLEIHQKLHRKLNSANENSWELYKPANWVPHVTLAYQLNRKMLQKATSKFWEIPLPLRSCVKQIGILEFEPHKDIVRYNFK